jgi:hypothetical protein
VVVVVPEIAGTVDVGGRVVDVVVDVVPETGGSVVTGAAMPAGRVVVADVGAGAPLVVDVERVLVVAADVDVEPTVGEVIVNPPTATVGAGGTRRVVDAVVALPSVARVAGAPTMSPPSPSRPTIAAAVPAITSAATGGTNLAHTGHTR